MGYIHYLVPFIFLIMGAAIVSLRYIKYGNKAYWIALILLILVMMQSNIKTINHKDKFSVNSRGIASALLTKYPNEKFNIVSCDDPSRELTLAVMFLLNSEKRISEQDRLIAVVGDGCQSGVLTKKDDFHELANFEKTHVYIVADSYKGQILSDTDNWISYDMNSLYNESTLWWMESNLD